LHFSTEATGSWRTKRPVVDHNLCVRCGICAEYCPTAAINMPARLDGSAPAGPGDPMLQMDWYTCKGCGICATVCPRTCIQMMPEEEAHNA